MRNENAGKFDFIKQELTDKVVNDIQEWGSARIFLERSTPHNRIDKSIGVWKGWEINKDFRIAAKKHFLSNGFVVYDCISPGGQLYGFQIEL